MGTSTASGQLTRAEDAYAHLASFQRGDVVDVGGRSFFMPGTVEVPQKHDFGDFPGAVGMADAYVLVRGLDYKGPGALEVKINVADLLSGKHTITSLDDAKAGNVRYFDAASYAAQAG